jgi:hypothetical protein
LHGAHPSRTSRLAETITIELTTTAATAATAAAAAADSDANALRRKWEAAAKIMIHPFCCD